MSESSRYSAILAVQSSTGSYEVAVAQGSFQDTLPRTSESYLLADAFFSLQLQHRSAHPLLIEATEHAKSLDSIPRIIEQLRAAGVSRDTRLTALGGGIIQDIAAFVASVYMRGIAWSYYPSTVLAMVDSCIGGKSSINVGPYKNLVGTFHPPTAIHIDPALARTLPPEQFASGLIEAAKICFCRGAESFADYLSYNPSPAMSTEALEQVILASLHAKKWFIEIDEFDKKERLLLNFGHTFGHALEGASNYAIPHGIAVGLGILCSLAFQEKRGVLHNQLGNVDNLKAHLYDLIGTFDDHFGALSSLDIENVFDRFTSDKKHSATSFTLILVDAGGQVALEKFLRSAEIELAIRSAIHTTLQTFATLPTGARLHD